jgi:hypothetical protein
MMLLNLIFGFALYLWKIKTAFADTTIECSVKQPSFFCEIKPNTECQMGFETCAASYCRNRGVCCFTPGDPSKPFCSCSSGYFGSRCDKTDDYQHSYVDWADQVSKKCPISISKLKFKCSTHDLQTIDSCDCLTPPEVPLKQSSSGTDGSNKGSGLRFDSRVLTFYFALTAVLYCNKLLLFYDV